MPHDVSRPMPSTHSRRNRSLAKPFRGSATPGRECAAAEPTHWIPCSRRATACHAGTLRSSIEDYWRRDDQHGGEALRPALSPADAPHGHQKQR
ncbi:hypothetical protein CGZ69_18740 [Streptomyces peucetius subsp. caesius ATCC 27952]|nr:hypothetical protein CGZ69_18740 [Streptomyces peucetius subsp. caesius ATCC 27952]